MGLKRKDLELLISDSIENRDSIIDSIMAKYGEEINTQKARVTELEQSLEEAKKSTEKYADYEELKKKNTEYEEKITGYETEKRNNSYKDVLKKLKYDSEFIDESLINKIGVEGDFEKNAQKFIEEHPKYAEVVNTREKGFQYEGGNQDFTGTSSVDYYNYLKEKNKK